MLRSYELLDRSNTVFSSFILCSSVLVLKMLAMSTLTSIQRFRAQIYPSPEDAVFSQAAQVGYNNEDINRVRRAHRNDMENILPFLTIGLIYILTEPSPGLAKGLFVIATLARILHTCVYAVCVVRQPARAICFFVQWSVTAYFAIASFVYFAAYIL